MITLSFNISHYYGSRSKIAFNDTFNVVLSITPDVAIELEVRLHDHLCYTCNICVVCLDILHMYKYRYITCIADMYTCNTHILLYNRCVEYTCIKHIVLHI